MCSDYDDDYENENEPIPMRPATTITSLDNPRVKAVVRLREGRERRKAGLFIAEGVREVTRAVEARLPLREIYLCPDLLGPSSSVLPTLNPQNPAFHVSPAVFRKMTYHDEPEGVLAVVETPSWTLETLTPLATDALLLVAVGTEKPGNLGAMVRTAEAAGCAAVIAAGAPVDAFNPNAIRASTAAVFSVPCVVCTEADALAWLTAQRVRIAAATLAPGSVAHTAADLSGAAGPLAIAIGPEDAGLSDAWLAAADATRGARVRIPMLGRLVDSLNASVAAGILLFEAVRQRGGA